MNTNAISHSSFIEYFFTNSKRKQYYNSIDINFSTFHSFRFVYRMNTLPKSLSLDFNLEFHCFHPLPTWASAHFLYWSLHLSQKICLLLPTRGLSVELSSVFLSFIPDLIQGICFD